MGLCFRDDCFARLIWQRLLRLCCPAAYGCISAQAEAADLRNEEKETRLAFTSSLHLGSFGGALFPVQVQCTSETPVKILPEILRRSFWKTQEFIAHISSYSFVAGFACSWVVGIQWIPRDNTETSWGNSSPFGFLVFLSCSNGLMLSFRPSLPIPRRSCFVFPSHTLRKTEIRQCDPIYFGQLFQTTSSDLNVCPAAASDCSQYLMAIRFPTV